MNSSDYDQFIVQKYRLAVALAILKTKPPNTSIEDHLNKLKEINETTDDDITICEGDFDIDENDSDIEAEFKESSSDSVNILENFDFNNLGDVSAPNASLVNVVQELNSIDDLCNKKDIQRNDSQSTYFEGSQKSDLDLINNIINEIDNEIISEQLTINNLKVNRQTDKVLTDVNDIDSQQTEVYTLRDYSEFNTHISQSQDNIVISKNLYLNSTKSDDFRLNNEIGCLGQNVNNSTDKVLNEDYDNVNVKTITNVAIDRKSKLNDSLKVKSKRMKVDLKIDLKSNENQLFNNPYEEFSTQFSTQSSHSKFDSSLNLDVLNTNSSTNPNIHLNTDNISDRNDVVHSTNQETNTDVTNEIEVIKTNEVRKANSFSLDEFEYNTQSQGFSLNHSKFKKVDKELDNLNNETVSDHREDEENRNLKLDLAKDRLKDLSSDQISNVSSDEISDLTESQAEIITFKVLEELSKVRSYLNRKSTKSDSGYRSFQPRYSGDSASQCSISWINESAHCLMNFLTSCPLVMSTVDITDDISKALGKLIDKLHEDEVYPNFLEEILEICSRLLNTVYEGRNYGENILNKDETILRILLLSRSSHIIKYSIEKVTIILENTLENLNESFEIEHTDKSENICYIFCILEDLLKRYNKYKNLSSQNSSQTSQDDRILKKSSLTEIWRKKWNLSKSDICEGTLDNKCSLSKCSDVLNKIIVRAMEGYSLISFAALQCFNLLQN